MRKLTIVSGGQTGVDRGALDAALECGFPISGWCPRDRLAEDGRISSEYPLMETSTPEYAERTRMNVRDSDGTIILSSTELEGGSLLTHVTAGELDRPVLVVDPVAAEVGEVIDWLRQHEIARLNVSGPRESEAPGISGHARRFIEALLRAIADES